MSFRRAAALITACAALAGFLWLAVQVSHDATVHFDAAVRASVHSHASPAVTSFMRRITMYGSEWFLVPFGGLLCLWFVKRGRPKDAVRLAVASLGAEVLNQVLKLLYHRIRPEAFFDYAQPSSFSFPSGHAIVSACFYGMLAMILAARLQGFAARALIVFAAAALVITIGISRVYLGVHHPTDVLAGYLMAVVWISLIRAY